MKLKSWKTTLIGFLTGLGLVIPQVVAVLDGSPETQFSLEGFAAGLAAMGIGFFARDNNKTDRAAGAN